MNWWMHLDKIRGSRPRCVSMIVGTRSTVAGRLTRLVGWPEVIVPPDSHWMPYGTPIQKPDGKWDVTPADEAKLDKPSELLLPDEAEKLSRWWLAIPGNANTPNWDIASTCTVNGQKGLLLIEAKAHDKELRGEEGGKKLAAKPSENSIANHVKIGHAVAGAAAEFQRFTGQPWAISRDQRYQMSNRFAMACKLTEMGYAVVLVYLGFLNVEEMRDCGQPFAQASDWDSLVRSHSEPLFPACVWNREWSIHGQTFIPLIRSVECEIEPKD